MPPFNSYATGPGPVSVTIADLNHDRHLDLVVSNGNSVSVLLGNGDGTFQQETEFPAAREGIHSYGIWSTAVGDLNGDGSPDVVAALRGDAERGDVTLLYGNGDGTLSQPQGLTASSNTASAIAAFIGDFNGDDLADVAVLFHSPPTSGVRVWLATQTGFEWAGYGPGGNTCRAWAYGDLNGDGRVDFVAPDDYDGSYGAGLGNADGSFRGIFDPREWIAAGPVAIGDLNGDGKQDVVTGLGVLLGNGDGTVGSLIDAFGGRHPAPLVLADVDADGRLDLLSADLLLLGKGDGTFGDAFELATGGGPPVESVGGLAVRDLNGDGRPDVVVANYSANTVTVLLNGVHVPVAVEDLQASRSEGRIRLGWSLSVEARRSLIGLQVRRAMDSAGPYTTLRPGLLEPAPAMSFEDPDVFPDRDYWYQIVLVSRDGTTAIAGSLRVPSRLSPSGGNVLRQPFVPTDGGPIQVQYTVTGSRTDVRLTIFDVRGHELRILDRGVRERGDYVRTWDRHATSGLSVPRGVYLVQLRASGATDTRKLVLLRR